MCGLIAELAPICHSSVVEFGRHVRFGPCLGGGDPHVQMILKTADLIPMGLS
jgi:hypothetical protein